MRVGTVIASSDGHEDAGFDQGGSSAVHGSGLAATKRHVGNSAVGATASLGVVGDKVDTGDDARVGSLRLNQSVFEQNNYIGESTYRTAGIEDLDSIELSLLCHTIGLGSNGSGDVGTMAVAINVLTVTSEVGQKCGTYNLS